MDDLRFTKAMIRLWLPVLVVIPNYVPDYFCDMTALNAIYESHCIDSKLNYRCLPIVLFFFWRWGTVYQLNAEFHALHPSQQTDKKFSWIYLTARLENKAVYTTASVAYGWAGAVMEAKCPFSVFLHCVTDGWTDGGTGGWTDRRTEIRKKSIKVSIFWEVGRKKWFPFFVCGAVGKLRWV